MKEDINQDPQKRLLLLKQAKLKQLEAQLQYQKKKGADNKTIYQTMKDIKHVKSEIKFLT